MEETVTSQQTRKKDQITTLLHHCMAVVGGFMGGYAVLMRGDFLGNAQTANLVYLVYAVLGRDVLHMLLRVLAVCLYILGTVSYVMIKNKTSWNVKVISWCVDLTAVILVGCIPTTVDPVVALLPIFFSMSLQWNAFPGNYGYVSSTIFSTNNVKQSTLAFSEYLCDGDKQHLHKMKFFLGSLLGFHIGVVMSYFSSTLLAGRGIWLNSVVLAFAGLLIWQETQAECDAKERVSANIAAGCAEVKGI